MGSAHGTMVYAFYRKTASGREKGFFSFFFFCSVDLLAACVYTYTLYMCRASPALPRARYYLGSRRIVRQNLRKSLRGGLEDISLLSLPFFPFFFLFFATLS
ncbi:hypothetical protein F4775DRAFT_520151 [Biscogniauxia sp. FL1348]|nr:hypothetical protein F4775DRAFT_520151 [Biscogniauxia sp. FL1348]